MVMISFSHKNHGFSGQHLSFFHTSLAELNQLMREEYAQLENQFQASVFFFKTCRSFTTYTPEN